MTVARALLCALALLAVAPSGAAASLKAIWGPTELKDGSSAFGLYGRLGVDVLQLQLSWREVAGARPAVARDPADPAYAWPGWLDLAAERAQRAGIRLALMVKETPAWANGGRDGRSLPGDLGDYGDFLVAAATRYPRVRHWMVWGEPTRGDAFEPMPRHSPRGPRAYARLLDRAYGALKSVRRSNVVIGGMTFTVGLVMPADFVRWMRVPDGRPPRLDWFGHNPFGTRFPDLAKDPYVRALRDMSDMDTFIGEVRRAYRGTGRRPRLWLSEFTVSSDHVTREFNFAVSRRAQARWLTAAFAIARRHSYIAGLGWYTLYDEEGGPDALTNGLLTAHGRRKPAYEAFRRAR